MADLTEPEANLALLHFSRQPFQWVMTSPRLVRSLLFSCRGLMYAEKMPGTLLGTVVAAGGPIRTYRYIACRILYMNNDVRLYNDTYIYIFVFWFCVALF